MLFIGSFDPVMNHRKFPLDSSAPSIIQEIAFEGIMANLVRKYGKKHIPKSRYFLMVVIQL